MRTYQELSRFATIQERYEYLRLDADVGCVTFGSARFKNQWFYRSREWRDVRNAIIYRDGGCDLGVAGFDIQSRGTVHHINPITEMDLEDRSPKLLDPNNLILCTHQTHNAIHYGDARMLPQEHVERFEGDTVPWR